MSEAFLTRIWLKHLRDQRRALVGWSLGIAGLCLMMAVFYPTIEAQGEQFQDLLESYPPAMRVFFGDLSDFTTPAGYLRAELFSMMLPLLFIIYAVGRGSDTIAGEEERGALDVLLSHPVSRSRIVLEKSAAIGVGLALLGFVTWTTLVVGGFAFGMNVSPLHLAAATVMVVFLGALFGAFALALGCLRGRKGLAVAIASGVAVFAYLLNSLAGLIDWLSAADRLSPFYYYMRGDPLTGGLDVVGFLALVALTAALVAMAVWAFERRDVGV